MKTKLFMLLLSIAILVFLTTIFSAHSDVAHADVTHCDTLSENQTWSASENVHIIDCDITIPLGVTLTVEEGAVVKFRNNASIFVNGTLRVLGTSDNPIYFTSIKDDFIGGDTNGDGYATSPAVEDWGRVEFRAESDDANSLIEHLVIRYSGNDGGWADDYGAIRLINASPTLRNITFENNYINGAEIAGGNWNTDIWDNTDVVYHVTNALNVPFNNTLTIVTGMQVHVYGDVTVIRDATLVVQHDVIVKFHNNASIFVSGTLRVLGTSANPIYFTSYRDDSVGGDTDGGGDSIGEVEDWGRVEFRAESDDANSLIEHLVIRYSGNDGGWADDYGAIRLINASPTLRNITFENNYINAVEIRGGDWETDIWDNVGVTYYVTADLSIPSVESLTIQPGVVVKFTGNVSLFVHGALKVLGTFENPIYFTSYRDDLVGGNSNGDGGTSTGAVEDWGRVEFQTGSDDANSLIEYLVIRYSGNDGGWADDYGAIRLMDVSPTIHYTTFVNNYRGIEALNGATPTLVCNDIHDNASFGIYNDTPAITVTAVNHWWGDVSGPSHSGNPGGSGQSVSDGVAYVPWATQSCLLTPVPDTPILQVSPTEMTVIAESGVSDPVVRPLNISNLGGGTLSWTATADSTWLAVEPASGIAPASPNVVVTVNDLLGRHEGQITIDGGTAQNSPKTTNVRLIALPNDPFYRNGEQWYLDQIDILGAWSHTQGSSDIVIAVIDSGVDYNHVDFDDAKTLTGDDWDYVHDDNDALDVYGHGTRVAGVLAAETNNEEAIAGVCPLCRILPIEVLYPTGSGTEYEPSDLAEAIDLAIEKDVDIINMSIGSTECHDEVADAINRAYEAGIVLVAAAGNDSNIKRSCLVTTIVKKDLRFPARFERVVSVGATDGQDKRAWFSNYGSETLDIMAPGVDILTNWPKPYNNDTHDKGTSFAAPMVSGVAGLLLSLNTDLEPAQVEKILEESADGNAGEWDQQTGWGRLNAARALEHSVDAYEPADPAICAIPVPIPSPSFTTQSSDDELISLYRQVRDEVLSHSGVGRQYIEHYNHYGPELAVTLLADPDLLTRTVQFLNHSAPAFRSLLPDSTEQVVLTQALYNETESLVRDIANASGPEIHDKMLQTWEDMGLDEHIGETATEIWEQMQERAVYLPIILKNY